MGKKCRPEDIVSAPRGSEVARSSLIMGDRQSDAVVEVSGIAPAGETATAVHGSFPACPFGADGESRTGPHRMKPPADPGLPALGSRILHRGTGTYAIRHAAGADECGRLAAAVRGVQSRSCEPHESCATSLDQDPFTDLRPLLVEESATGLLSSIGCRPVPPPPRRGYYSEQVRLRPFEAARAGDHRTGSGVCALRASQAEC
jgi:hypothetical protein